MGCPMLIPMRCLMMMCCLFWTDPLNDPWHDILAMGHPKVRLRHTGSHEARPMRDSMGLVAYHGIFHGMSRVMCCVLPGMRLPMGLSI